MSHETSAVKAEREYNDRIGGWAAERGLSRSIRMATGHHLSGRQTRTYPQVPSEIRDLQEDVLDHAVLFTRDNKAAVLLSHVYAYGESGTRDPEVIAEVVEKAKRYADHFGLSLVVDDPADRIYIVSETLPLRFERMV